VFLIDGVVKRKRPPLVRKPPPKITPIKPPEAPPPTPPIEIKERLAPPPTVITPTPIQRTIEFKTALAQPEKLVTPPMPPPVLREEDIERRRRQIEMLNIMDQLDRLMRSKTQVAADLEKTKLRAVRLLGDIHHLQRRVEDLEPQAKEAKPKINSFKAQIDKLINQLNTQDLTASERQDIYYKIGVLGRQIAYLEAILDEYETAKKLLEELRAQYEKARDMEARHQAELDRIEEEERRLFARLVELRR